MCCFWSRCVRPRAGGTRSQGLPGRMDLLTEMPRLGVQVPPTLIVCGRCFPHGWDQGGRPRVGGGLTVWMMPTTPMTSWVLNTGTPRCPCGDSRECQSCPERESQDVVYVVLDSAAKDNFTCTANPLHCGKLSKTSPKHVFT